jgi:hypothetical protein
MGRSNMTSWSCMRGAISTHLRLLASRDRHFSSSLSALSHRSSHASRFLSLPASAKSSATTPLFETTFLARADGENDLWRTLGRRLCETAKYLPRLPPHRSVSVLVPEIPQVINQITIGLADLQMGERGGIQVQNCGAEEVNEVEIFSVPSRCVCT